MRAIDGDALKRKAQKVATESWKMKIKANIETILNQFIDWIDAEPTIEERKKGKWLVDEDGNTECPFCGNTCGFGNYCNECGAYLRGENDA